MKKVKLSVADGKIKINHPDLADEYLRRSGRCHERSHGTGRTG